MRELRISAVEVLAVRGPRPPRQPGPVQVQIRQELPRRAGFGIELDSAKIDSQGIWPLRD